MIPRIGVRPARRRQLVLAVAVVALLDRLGRGRRREVAARGVELPDLPGERTSGTGGSTRLPVRSDSATLIASIGLGNGLHPDFGSYSGYGIPYNVVEQHDAEEAP